MRIFNLADGFKAVCTSESTRYGFRHLATLYAYDGTKVSTAKCCYYNRTWESFQFASVLNAVVRRADIPDVQREALILGGFKNGTL